MGVWPEKFRAEINEYLHQVGNWLLFQTKCKVQPSETYNYNTNESVQLKSRNAMLVLYKSLYSRGKWSFLRTQRTWPARPPHSEFPIPTKATLSEPSTCGTPHPQSFCVVRKVAMWVFNGTVVFQNRAVTCAWNTQSDIAGVFKLQHCQTHHLGGQTV